MKQEDGKFAVVLEATASLLPCGAIVFTDETDIPQQCDGDEALADFLQLADASLRRRAAAQSLCEYSPPACPKSAPASAAVVCLRLDSPLAVTDRPATTCADLYAGFRLERARERTSTTPFGTFRRADAGTARCGRSGRISGRSHTSVSPAQWRLTTAAHLAGELRTRGEWVRECDCSRTTSGMQ